MLRIPVATPPPRLDVLPPPLDNRLIVRPASPRSRRSLLLLALAGCGCGGDPLAGSSRLDSGTDSGPRRDLALDDDAYFTHPPPAPPDLALAGLGPPYPIVLVHGMAGFRNIGPLEYFHLVPDALRRDGHDVWVSRADPINDSEVRGEQVKWFVRDVLQRTGKARVVLVGHSQGGFDVRYVAAELGGRVAAVVAIASPGKGDQIADLALSAGPGAQRAIDTLLELYGAVQGFDSHAKAQIQLLSTAGAKAFAARHPNHPLVAYYSISGRSNGAAAGGPCASADEPPFIRQWSGARDPVDPLFAAASRLLDGLQPRPVNDGLVTVESAKLGTFLGCIPADHMDEVNQLAGDPPGFGNPFNAVQFYRDLASWLRAKGY